MSPYLLSGTVPMPTSPYLSLSGTSMSTAVVSGSVALLLQANPSLTPNAVKAVLEYTAQIYPSYDALTEGAGFLNAYGAVQLARVSARRRMLRSERRRPTGAGNSSGATSA